MRKTTASKEPVVSVEGNDRQRALDQALGQVERSFGKGAVMRLGDSSREAIEAIPTGSLSLDMA
ncbi:DNA recombination/repair protein RecA, partial [bacterium]